MDPGLTHRTVADFTWGSGWRFDSEPEECSSFRFISGLQQRHINSSVESCLKSSAISISIESSSWHKFNFLSIKTLIINTGIYCTYGFSGLKYPGFTVYVPGEREREWLCVYVSLSLYFLSTKPTFSGFNCHNSTWIKHDSCGNLHNSVKLLTAPWVLFADLFTQDNEMSPKTNKVAVFEPIVWKIWRRQTDGFFWNFFWTPL